MRPLTLYSEVLRHIKQTTIWTELPTPSNGSTGARLSSNRTSIIVDHDGDSAVLRLPCQVQGQSTLDLRESPSKELSFRLSNDGPHFDAAPAEVDPAPPTWTAASLGPQTHLACGSCTHVLVAGNISSWRDLPSDNWAEMMDFWHCHKPEADKNTRSIDRAVDKGYAAGRQIAALPGMGFVDSLHLQLHPHDCNGLEVSYGLRLYPSTFAYHLESLAERKRPAPC